MVIWPFEVRVAAAIVFFFSLHHSKNMSNIKDEGCRGTSPPALGRRSRQEVTEVRDDVRSAGFEKIGILVDQRKAAVVQ